MLACSSISSTNGRGSIPVRPRLSGRSRTQRSTSARSGPSPMITSRTPGSAASTSSHALSSSPKPLRDSKLPTNTAPVRIDEATPVVRAAWRYVYTLVSTCCPLIRRRYVSIAPLVPNAHRSANTPTTPRSSSTVIDASTLGGFRLPQTTDSTELFSIAKNPITNPGAHRKRRSFHMLARINHRGRKRIHNGSGNSSVDSLDFQRTRTARHVVHA
jgi:hypothetical protein